MITCGCCGWRVDDARIIGGMVAASLDGRDRCVGIKDEPMTAYHILLAFNFSQTVPFCCVQYANQSVGSYGNITLAVWCFCMCSIISHSI